MEIIETPLKDCLVIKSKVFGDDRGFFLESFNKKGFAEAGLDFDVKQINFAKSMKNVLRGLHYQEGDWAQSKLVGVISGSVLDVAVDMRKDSPTFKKHFKLEISTQDTFLLVPRGFAHAYYTLEDNTVFYYAVDNYYNPKAEKGLLYNDATLGIDWEFENEPIVSQKDKNWPVFLNAEL